MPGGVRSRRFHLTVNNPRDDECPIEAHLSYYIIGRESAPTTGTRHLQVYVVSRERIRATTLIGWLRGTSWEGAHVEVAKGTHKQGVDYCKKGGDWTEWGHYAGDPESQGASGSDHWERALTLARSGQIEDIKADIQVRYYGNLEKICRASRGETRRLRGPCGVLLYGPPGTGKSTRARSCSASVFQKDFSKWWDMYMSEEVVVLDDLDPSNAKLLTTDLKLWMDQWPFKAQIKGGYLQIRPRLVVITSNYPPRELFPNWLDWGAISRRLLLCEEMKERGDWPAPVLQDWIEDDPSSTRRTTTSPSPSPRPSAGTATEKTSSESSTSSGGSSTTREGAGAAKDGSEFSPDPDPWGQASLSHLKAEDFDWGDWGFKEEEL